MTCSLIERSSILWSSIRYGGVNVASHARTWSCVRNYTCSKAHDPLEREYILSIENRLHLMCWSIENKLLHLERTHSETCNARRQSRKAPMPLSKEPYPKIRESPTKSVYTHTHTHTQHTHTHVSKEPYPKLRESPLLQVSVCAF